LFSLAKIGVVGLTRSFKQGCSANKRGVGTHPKIAILKQLQTHFKAKRGKGVGTAVPTPPQP